MKYYTYRNPQESSYSSRQRPGPATAEVRNHSREIHTDDISEASTDQPNRPSALKRDPRLVFVVQKHLASRLHYDLRLEVQGDLKSWAVPKGPSANPQEKRLALQTENHVYAYKDFEGRIPEGEYGAGDVIVWDRGWYEPVGPGAGPNDRMVRGLRRGAIRFILHGKKLKGGYSLIRFREPDQWLFTKRADTHASDGSPITEDDASVISGKHLPG